MTRKRSNFNKKKGNNNQNANVKPQPNPSRAPKTIEDLLEETSKDELSALNSHIHNIQSDIFNPNSASFSDEVNVAQLVLKLREAYAVYKTRYPVWTHMKPIVDEAIRIGKKRASMGQAAFPTHVFEGMNTEPLQLHIKTDSDNEDNMQDDIEVQIIKQNDKIRQDEVEIKRKQHEEREKQNVVNSSLHRMYMNQNDSKKSNDDTKQQQQQQQDQRGVKRNKDDIVDDEVTDQLKKRLKTKQEERSAPNNPPTKKRKTTQVAERPTLRYSDLGGIEPVLQDIRELIEYPFTHPEIYTHLGVEPPRGILLYGPPGSGKTMLATAIAGELGVPFFRISAPEVVSGMSGESEAKIRSLFSEAIKIAPSLIFIDEIDAITPKRETASREMEKRIVAQFLTCLDDCSFDNTDGKMVLVIGATNRPDSLDPALRRAGRFDREISLGIPDEAARKKILQVLSRKLRLSGDFDFQKIARMTPGFVGADLRALTKESAVLAINRIFHDLFEEEANTAANMDIEDEQMSNIDAALHKRAKVSLLLKGQREPLSEDQLETLSITMDDFEQAVKKVQPSSKREGFATIPNVTWEDIGALTEIRDELRLSIMEPIKNPEKYKKLGLSAPSGVLLYGPPGCGKTLLAKAVSNDSGANFISIKGPELLNKFVGESERAVRQVFARARASSPCVVFFDELDALCPKRGYDSSNASSERVVNQLLTEMDGLESRRSVFVIAATNRPDIIDPAMLRPGRLDKMLYVSLPSPEERLAILKTVARKTPLQDDVNLEEIAKSPYCENYSGADLAQLVREASVCCLKEHLLQEQSTKQKISNDTLIVAQKHFKDAFFKVVPSVSPKDRKMYDNMNQRLTNVRRRDQVQSSNSAADTGNGGVQEAK